MKFLDSVTQLSLGLWAGSMAGFALTAPQLFAAFGSERQRAGDLAGSMIWRLNFAGMILGAVALVALLPRIRLGLNRWRAGLVATALLLALTGALYIFPQLQQARPPVPIEQLSAADPLRVRYNQWHKRSEQLFGVAILMVAGAVLLGPPGGEGRRHEGR